MKHLPTKHARRRFTVVRDEQGVPRITAPTWREALYGLGYMHAVDRPTQMLFSRAVASGQAAELIADKPELVETDRFFRRAGLYVHLEREIHDLDDETFDELTAYCEGVNDGLKGARRSLPMWAAGFVPTPWNQKAVLLVGNLLSYGGLVVGQQQNERIILELVQAGVSDDKLRELFDPWLAGADFDLLREVKMARQLSDQALELLTDLPRLAGSNAWAVAPKRSTSGGALLAADPHLEVNRLPALWYEATLEWSDGYVMGATLPGCPLFGIARNANLAWGVTYLKGDTSDFFIEHCRPGGSSGWQYRRGQQWFDFSVRREAIEHKGSQPESFDIYYNDQGTLEAAPEPGTEGYYLSVSWVGDKAGAGRSISTWLDIVHTATAKEAMDLVRECPLPTLMWVMADREGHIGRQASGWFPRRGGDHSGLLPAAAWEVKNHWRGVLASDVLPRQFDPSEGFVASANEDVETRSGIRLVTQPVPDYRKRRIVELLGDLDKATLEDMQAMQYDVVSVQARELLDIFLPCLPDGPVKEKLSAWDCSYRPDSKEATLFTRLYRYVILEIFGQEQGLGWRRMLYLCTRTGFSLMVLTSIDRLLAKERSTWWEGRDKEELIRRAAARLNGEKDEPWSHINHFRFVNRFMQGRFFNRALGLDSRELPMPGCHATLFQGHLLKAGRRESTFAPSYHFVTDLGTDEAWTNLPGGPSESRLSGYYKSDVRLWLTGRYKRLWATRPAGNHRPHGES